MNKDTRRLLAYGLTVTMLFNAATVNQNKKVYVSISFNVVKHSFYINSLLQK